MKRQREKTRERDIDSRDRRAEFEEARFAEAQEKESLEREQARIEKEVVALKELNERKMEVDDGVRVVEEDIVTSRIMTKDDRMNAIRQLVAGIPVDKEGLWCYSCLL